MLDESCQKCLNNCYWLKYVNDVYCFEIQYEIVEKEYDDIRKRYNIVVEGLSEVEVVIK